MVSGTKVQQAKQHQKKRNGRTDRRITPVIAGSVGRILKKLRAIELEIEEKKGPFTLWGFFFRENVLGWEIVGSAPWLDPHLRGLEFIGKYVHRDLTHKELLSIAGTVLMEPKSDFITALREELSGREAPIELRNVEINEQRIKRAYVLTFLPAKARGSRGNGTALRWWVAEGTDVVNSI